MLQPIFPRGTLNTNVSMTNGLKVKLVISKKIPSIDKNHGEDSKIEEPLTNHITATLDGLEIENEDDFDKPIYQTDVESSGKFSRKATWTDLSRFTGEDINSDALREWILQYQEKCYPDDLKEPNHTPHISYIKDEKGETLYKDFGWKPIKLNLKPGVVDVKEQWTKRVTLESFPLDFSTDTDKILSLDKCDKEITSWLRKSKITGHPLALEMLKSDPEISTEFKGVDSITFGVFGNGGPNEVEEDTGCKIWKDVKTIRALLQDAEFPTRRGGNSREARVDFVANESYMKARIYYKAFFSNDVASDHKGKFRGLQYWKIPIKYLFEYNDVPNAVLLYEDIELRYFTDIRLSMDNRDWEWIRDENGRWKQNKV